MGNISRQTYHVVASPCIIHAVLGIPPYSGVTPDIDSYFNPFSKEQLIPYEWCNQ